MSKKEYNEGYKAAIEAMKQAAQNKNNGDLHGGGQGDNQQMPAGMSPLPSDLTGDGNNSQSKGGSKGSKGGGGSKSGSGSQGDGGNSGNQGVVMPEDCIGPSQLGDIPSTPGGMLDKSTGDQIADMEGYDKEGGSEEAIANNWKDRALQAASKMKGTGAGNFVNKINSLYKSSNNWKRDLQKIVGSSINTEDRRSAYANKNVLISQDRLARTDKDKYDVVDYIVACVDTSGSMDQKTLTQCLTEVYQVALQKKPLSIYIIQFDSRVQDVQKFTGLAEFKRNIPKITIKGGGGTDVGPCWELLKTDKRFKGRRAELVMVFTDGYLTQYKRDPKTMNNLAWVILDNTGFELQYKEAKTKLIHISTKQK